MRDDRIVVFGGPSLHGPKPTYFETFRFRPPAGAGDVVTEASSGTSLIVLIDGYFGDRKAVQHKEILYCLSLGIPVMGAASIGALRAVECRLFGMMGFGSIFDQYLSGARWQDSDVAITHAPKELDYAPTSVALVDIDATIDKVATRLDPGEIEALRVAARNTHFKERTIERVVSNSKIINPDAVSSTLNQSFFSQKRLDSLELLDGLASGKIDFAAASRRELDWSLNSTGF